MTNNITATQMEFEDFLEGTRSEETEEVPVRYEITSYGADFDVSGLIRRFSEQSIEIPPFQRSFVWSIKQASQFIESLLLGLPVPGIFLYRDKDSNKLKVIDGQQRLTSLLFFYDGIWKPSGKEFRLSGLKSEYDGRTYKDLSVEDKRILDDSILHATIAKQDKPEDDDSSTFELYRRINKSGTPLSDQEIRSAIYQGDFNDLLKGLVTENDWVELMGEPDKRMKKEELVLRFFALYFDQKNYVKPMREFLNKFMRENRYIQKEQRESFRNILLSTISAFSVVGKQAFKRLQSNSLNVAAFDAMMIGVAKRLERGPIKKPKAVLEAHNELLATKRFDVLISDSTSDVKNVDDRIKLAIKAFENIK